MDPLYILYTSGTTGQPKGVVRTNAGHMVALAWTMRNIYAIEPGEVFWAASDVGWVVGHSYICYAPLLVGATTVVFEGKPVGTPDAGTFWRVIAEHGVGASSPRRPPSARSSARTRRASWSRTTTSRACATCSSPASGPTRTPSNGRGGSSDVPVIDHWWQTETGWAIAANPVGIELLPVKLGSPTVPMPGYDVQILSEAGEPLPAGRARRGGDPPAAAAGDAADALERRRPLRARRTSRPSPATTRPATPG